MSECTCVRIKVEKTEKERERERERELRYKSGDEKKSEEQRKINELR